MIDQLIRALNELNKFFDQQLSAIDTHIKVTCHTWVVHLTDFFACVARCLHVCVMTSSWLIQITTQLHGDLRRSHDTHAKVTCHTCVAHLNTAIMLRRLLTKFWEHHYREGRNSISWKLRKFPGNFGKKNHYRWFSENQCKSWISRRLSSDLNFQEIE